MPISAGIKAPDFALPDETGEVRQLSGYCIFIRRMTLQDVQLKRATFVMITVLTKMRMW